MKQVGIIKEIWRFPVKSMFGESVQQAVIAPQGMPEDRHWALRDDEAGEITHGKKIPKIMTLRARYLRDPKQGFSEMANTQIEIIFPDGSTTTSLDPYVNARLSMYLGRRVSLCPRYTAEQAKHYELARPMTFDETRYVLGMKPDGPMPDFSYFPLSMLQTISKYACPPGTYYDVYPLHFMTTASLEKMREFYPEGDFRPERYRPGFVIETNPDLKGFIENEWEGSRLKIGELIIDCGHPTIRCSMPGAEQPEISRDPKIPQMVQQHAGQNLGLYAASKKSGVIKVGDMVELLPPRMRKTVQVWQSLKRSAKTAVFSQTYNMIQKKQDKERPAPGRYPKGFRPVILENKQSESKDVSSFIFRPEDGKALPVFLPGQHIVLALPGGKGKPDIYRPYTLSGGSEDNSSYRISVKLETFEADGAEQHGVGSEYLHNTLKQGDTVHIKGPLGKFAIIPDDPTPLVLMCTGVGITPFISMINTLADENPTRSITLFYGIRSVQYFPFGGELKNAQKKMPNLKIYLSVTNSDSALIQSTFDVREGRISADQVIGTVGKSGAAQFLLCGSNDFTTAMIQGLQNAGVTSDHIHHEIFSKKRAQKGAKAPGESYSVEFLRSGVKVDWDADQDNLLTLAEDAGVPAVSGCRYGACQACEATLVSGEINYADEVDPPSGKNKILLCSALPESNLVIDL